MPSRTDIKSGSFAVGSTETTPISLNEYALVGITSGSNLTATSLTFQVSSDNVIWYPLFTDLGEYAITASSAVRAYALDPTAFMGWNLVKLRQGTSSSAVAQATATGLVTFLLRDM